jgi:hypothetical protein
VAGFDEESVVVVRPAGVDEFGDEVPGVTEFAVAGCLFAPGSSDEGGFGTNQVVTDGAVYGPVGMDVEATDRIRIRGDLYVVVGFPQRWGPEGTVVAVRRYTG